MAAALTVSAALEFQNAEMDAEVALILGRCAPDEIDQQIEEIDQVIAILRVLGRVPADEGIEKRIENWPQAV